MEASFSAIHNKSSWILKRCGTAKSVIKGNDFLEKTSELIVPIYFPPVSGRKTPLYLQRCSHEVELRCLICVNLFMIRIHFACIRIHANYIVFSRINDVQIKLLITYHSQIID